MNSTYLSIYKFKKFIKKCNIYENLDYDHLSYNPHAINYLYKNQDKINWDNLSLNSSAVKLLYLNKNKIYWLNLALNYKAYEFILSNIQNINTKYLYFNKNNLIRNLYKLKRPEITREEQMIIYNSSKKFFNFYNNSLMNKHIFINSYYNTDNKKWSIICENPFLFYKYKLLII